MTYHDCHQETEIALLKQSMETNNLLTKEIHNSVVGNGRIGIKTQVELLRQGQKRIYWVLGIMLVGSAIIKVFLKI